MKVEAQVHIVPHLKALISIKLGLLKAKPWWYFCCVSELSEKSNLLHKIGFFKTGVVGTCTSDAVDSVRHMKMNLFSFFRMPYN